MSKILVQLGTFLVVAALIVLGMTNPWVKVSIGLGMIFILAARSYVNNDRLLYFSIGGGLSNMGASIINGGPMPVLNPGFSLDSTHSVMTSGTHLKLLCDIFHIGSSMVLSVGDIAIAIYILTFFVTWVYTKIRKVEAVTA